MGVKLKDERAIICTTDGTIYPSVEDAAKHYHLRLFDIRKVLRKKQKTTYGLVFAYVTPNQSEQKKIFFEDEIKRKVEADRLKRELKTSNPSTIVQTYRIFGIPVWTKTSTVH